MNAALKHTFRQLCHSKSKPLVYSCYCNFQSSIVALFEEGVKIQNVKDITPREHEALVQVECAGVNYSDLLMLKGKYHLQSKLPFTLGFELAGVVQSVGKNVKRLKEGDRIFCIKSSGISAFAEYCTVNEKEDVLVKLPYSISSELAASVGVAYGSAFLGMKRLVMERKGNSFLILTSRGTTGLAAIDLAQNVFEGIVFGASDSETKLEYLRSLNVLSTLNWTDGKLLKNIHDKTFGKGVDYVIETVGGNVFNQGLECLKSGGHVLSLAFSSGEYPKIDLLDLHRLNATVSGVWLGGREQRKIEDNLDLIFKLFDDGFLKGLKVTKFALTDVKKCLEAVQNADFFGKAVLTMY